MPIANAVVDVPSGMFPMLATFNFFVAFGLMTVAGLLAFFNSRGLGFSGRKVKQYEESKDLSVAINFVTGFIYLMKAIDFTSGAEAMSFSLNAVAYLDYTLTCPMLVYDLGHTIGLSHSAFYGVSTFIVLLTAVMATIAEAPRCYAYFAVGSIQFVIVGFFIYRGIIKDVWPKCAPQARSSLRSGLIIFFSVWPCFPILWLFSSKAFNVLPTYLILLLHGVLDLLAKSVFGIFVLRYRLFMEDAALAKFDADMLEQGQAGEQGEDATSSFIVRWLGGEKDRQHADPVSAGREMTPPHDGLAKAAEVATTPGAALRQRGSSGSGHNKWAVSGSQHTRTTVFDGESNDDDDDETSSETTASSGGNDAGERERVAIRLKGGREAVVFIGMYDSPLQLAAAVAEKHALSRSKEAKLRGHLENVQRELMANRTAERLPTVAHPSSSEDVTDAAPQTYTRTPSRGAPHRESARSVASRRSRRSRSRAGSRASRRSRSRTAGGSRRGSPADVHVVHVPSRV